MRKVLGLSITLIALLAQTTAADARQSTPGATDNAAILIPSNLSAYNQQGFNLPAVPRSSGQDSVRGAGGISCQSAVNTGGPVFDAGVIGTNDVYSRDSTALYGRITIPLGHKPKRIDCTTLYNLEVERLKLEIQMLRLSQAHSSLIMNEDDRLQAAFEAARAADGNVPPPTSNRTPNLFPEAPLQQVDARPVPLAVRPTTDVAHPMDRISDFP